jgi:hypothetical protein
VGQCLGPAWTHLYGRLRSEISRGSVCLCVIRAPCCLASS